MKYTEVKFNISCADDLRAVAADLLADVAGGCGFEAFTDDGSVLTGYIQTESFSRMVLDAAISDFPMKDVAINYTSSEVEDKDWNEQWEDNGFNPIEIDTRCTIYDAKHTDMDEVAATNKDRLNIFIEAKQAFGTGTHETTQMIVSHLMDMDLKGQSVLDCGCGTGILGIVAAKTGAEKVVAYDIDEWSVENTRHNAVLNNVDNIEVLLGDSAVLSHVSGLFDVVVANINRNILLADMDRFCKVMRQGSMLILSGFYTEDEASLIEKAEQCGLTKTQSFALNNWECLVLQYQ